MAGKVLEVKALLQGDNLAKEIASLYNKFSMLRQTKVDEWKELRNYIFAVDTTKTTNSKLPWKNKTTLPKLTQIRDNLHANYRSALFSNADWLIWKATANEGVTKRKAKAIQAYMRNKLNESDFEETVDKLLYDYIDYGNVFAEVVFERNYKVDTETGENIPGYIGPRLVRISPYDIVFNPASASFKNSPKMTRYIKSIGELKEEATSRPDLGYTDELLSRLQDTRSALSQFQSEDINKAEGFVIDGFGSLSEYYQSGYVEIIEFEGDIYDSFTDTFLKDHIITIVDRAWVVRKEANPSWLGSAAKRHIGWRERPDNLYAMGPLDNLVGMQYRIDHLENLKADALDLTIHPPLKVVGDVPSFVWGPNAIIHIPDADGDVSMMAPNAAAIQVNTEIAYLQNVMEEMAGAPKEAMGLRSPGEKTAFEVQQLQNAASRLFQDKISKFERYFLEPLLNIMLEVARRNFESVEVVGVLDDDLGVVDFLEVTKEDITASGKLKPMGARHFSAKAQLTQNLIGIFNSPVGGIIAPHVSGKGLAKLIEELFEVERFQLIRDNVAVFEQAETQGLASQAQQENELQEVTPGVAELSE